MERCTDLWARIVVLYHGKHTAAPYYYCSPVLWYYGVYCCEAEDGAWASAANLLRDRSIAPGMAAWLHGCTAAQDSQRLCRAC